MIVHLPVRVLACYAEPPCEIALAIRRADPGATVAWIEGLLDLEALSPGRQAVLDLVILEDVCLGGLPQICAESLVDRLAPVPLYIYTRIPDADYASAYLDVGCTGVLRSDSMAAQIDAALTVARIRRLTPAAA